MASAGTAVVQYLTEEGLETRTKTSAISNGQLLSARDTNRDLIPDWVQLTGRALHELLQLPAGWDSYGAKQIKLSSVQNAVELLKRVMSDLTPPPDVVPTSRGGVQLEWHTEEIDIEITIPPDGFAEMYVQRFGAGKIEGTLPQSLSDLQRAISQLSGSPPAV